ncbi:hypothetical protein BJY01DRAFT_223165 [Aspergillus pseudoustus]|uniref:Uncharacterized protein n=1 Tax=Aspergillus pseudoustus TaxID=1810923 RepID=A0ABR4J6N7_9EURO
MRSAVQIRVGAFHFLCLITPTLIYFHLECGSSQPFYFPLLIDNKYVRFCCVLLSVALKVRLWLVWWS